MPQAIKLTIEIEKDSHELGNIQCRIFDILFTDLSCSVDLENMQYKLKNCISKFKGFGMLTITITKGEQFELYPAVIKSVRFVESYGEIKKASFVHSSYSNWIETNAKDVFGTLKDMAEQTNRLFVDTLRELNKVVCN